MEYVIHLLILWSIYSVLAASANLTLAWSGLFNIAIAALFGAGAYTAALLPEGNSIIYACSLLVVCGLVATTISLIMSFTLQLLRGDYFALATLAFGIVFFSVLRNFVGGVPGIARPGVFTSLLPSYDLFAPFVITISLFLIWSLHRITTSAVGVVLLAQSYNPAQVATMGYNVFGLRAASLAASAFCAGSAGCLYVWHLSVAVPRSFTIGQAFTIISMAVIGGVATPWSAPIGALTILTIPELIIWLNPGGANAQVMSEIIAGLCLLAVLLLRTRLEATGLIRAK